MSTRFRIGVNTEEEILSNPPPEFRHANLIFTPFAVRVDQFDYPIAAWTDFAGVLLFKWYRAVWLLSSGDSRAARLPFWYRYEIWLRQTRGTWWRLSLVQRETDDGIRQDKTILHEALVIPEVVEAALLTTIQKLLAGARSAGVWTEDCVALAELLERRESYLEDLEAGRIPLPHFLSGRVPTRPNQTPQQWGSSLGFSIGRNGEPRLSRTDGNGSGPVQRRNIMPPFLCPRCSALLHPWGPTQTQQTCPLCKHDIRLG